jgi:predicted anti-sigma-YlaC factor YlaD
MVTDAMEGALLGSQLARFEEHLAHCEWCTLFSRQIREVVAVLKALPPETPAADERVLESFRRRYSR